MKDLLDYLVKLIVNNPDDVKVEVDEKDDYINLKLAVNEEDKGLVIGKGGKTIRALRTMLRVKAIKENKRFNLELVE